MAVVNEGPFEEAVLPLKRQSDGTLGVGSSGGGGGGQMSVVIQAVDAASFVALAERSGDAFAGIIVRAIENSPALKDGFQMSGTL